MQKQAGTLQGLGYVEQDAGEASYQTAEQTTYSFQACGEIVVEPAEPLTCENLLVACMHLMLPQRCQDDTLNILNPADIYA